MSVLFETNPHIVSIDRAKNFYKPIHLKWWNDMTKNTSHLEKELMDIIVKDVKLLGTEQAHKRWGCFVWGVWGGRKPQTTCRTSW